MIRKDTQCRVAFYQRARYGGSRAKGSILYHFLFNTLVERAKIDKKWLAVLGRQQRWNRGFYSSFEFFKGRFLFINLLDFRGYYVKNYVT